MFTKEMMDALEADGEKLRQLTGADHGPVFLPPGSRTDLPCASLPPWSDDENERCPFCNAKRGEPCGLEADDE
jgi:hypothetical protein